MDSALFCQEASDVRKKWLKPVGSVILAMGGVIWLLPLLKGFNIDVDRLLAILPGQNSYIPCLLLLYCVQSLSPIAFLPYNVLVVVTSMLLPLPLALAINLAGTLLVLILPYEVGKHAGARQVRKWLDKKPAFHRFSQEGEETSFLFSYTTRVLGVPNAIAGMAFGSVGMPLLPYLFSGLLGLAPKALCFSLLGNNLDLSSPYLWGMIGLNLLILLLVMRHVRANNDSRQKTLS